MKSRIMICFGSCAILLSSLSADAQDLSGIPGGGPTAVAVAPAAPAGPNLFTMLLPPPDMMERCRVKLCRCEAVKMLRASLAPAAAMTGGLIPVGNCCPTIKKEDLAKPADSSEGAAARIKKDVEEAAARRAAVRYLGTVDCRYWPEAEQALIDALRADKIECVRYEAALALQRGCCCTKKVAKALTISIEGTETDGHPAERSCRVQDAAAMALSMCAIEEKSEKKDEQGPEKKQQARVDPKNFYRDLETATSESIFGSARKALESRNSMNSTQVISQSHRAASMGLIGMFSHSVESTNEASQRTTGAREPQLAVAANPQPQRRGLLFKLLPGSAYDEPVAYNSPAPVVQPVPQPVILAQPTPAPAAVVQPRRLPAANEIRPVGYVAPPAYGTMKTDDSAKGFSTASPNNPPLTPAPGVPATTSTSSAPRSDGLLGFVIMNDANRK